MGLFINSSQHPTIYKNQGSLITHNQKTSSRDFLTEWKEEQEKSVNMIQHSLQSLEGLFKLQKKNHTKQWRNLNTQIDDILEYTVHQEEVEGELIQWLVKLEKRFHALDHQLGISQLSDQQQTEKLAGITSITEDILMQNELNRSTYVDLLAKMSQQIENQEMVVEKLQNQENQHQKMVDKLKGQDAVLDKVTRQLDFIRSIIFERSNYIAEKIEDGYKLATFYMYQALVGTRQPLSFFWLKDKNKNDTEN